MTRAEAFELMLCPRQIVSPQANKPVIGQSLFSHASTWKFSCLVSVRYRARHAARLHEVHLPRHLLRQADGVQPAHARRELGRTDPDPLHSQAQAALVGQAALLDDPAARQLGAKSERTPG